MKTALWAPAMAAVWILALGPWECLHGVPTDHPLLHTPASLPRQPPRLTAQCRTPVHHHMLCRPQSRTPHPAPAENVLWACQLICLRPPGTTCRSKLAVVIRVCTKKHSQDGIRQHHADQCHTAVQPLLGDTHPCHTCSLVSQRSITIIKCLESSSGYTGASGAEAICGVQHS